MKLFFLKYPALISLISIIIVSFSLSSVSTITYAQAASKQTACKGVGYASGSSSTGCASQGISVNDIIASTINVLGLFAGAIAVIMIMVAGLKYVSSGGDEKAVAGAKNTIIYALIGLVVLGISQFLVHFILGFTGTVIVKKGT